MKRSKDNKGLWQEVSQTVTEHPWLSVAIATGAGALVTRAIGLLGRGRSRALQVQAQSVRRNFDANESVEAANAAWRP